MFSQASVILSTWRGESASMGVYFQGILQGGSAPGRVCIHGRSASRGDWADPPLDTTGYAQREGGTHPTRMHSCFTPHGG